MKKTYVVAVAMVIFVCVPITGCDRDPDSLKTIKSQLDHTLAVKFKYISMDSEKSNALSDGYIRVKNYYFEDEHGIRFTVSTGSHANGTQLFSNKLNLCDYVKSLFAAEKDIVDKAMGSGLPIEFYPSGSYENSYKITVSSYSDLEQAATMIESGLNAIKPFPINPSGKEILFDRPNIWVDPSHGSSYRGIKEADFYFLREGEISPTYDKILEQLQNGYVKLIKEGYLEEAVPREERFNYPASVINCVYVNDERADYKFMYYKSQEEYRSYYCFFVTDNFAELVKMLGGTFCINSNNEKHIATWSIGADTWNAEADKFSSGISGYENLVITKNGEKLSLSVTNTLGSDGNGFTLPEFEQMLNVTIVVEQWDPIMRLYSDASQ